MTRQNKVKSTDPDPYMDKKTPVYALQKYFGKNIEEDVYASRYTRLACLGASLQ